MNALVCELCGGTEFVKQDGFYVCQNCGAKLSPEEAKKLMGVVDGANPPVTVNSNKLNNLYERARKSLEVDDLKHAAEYYKQILDERPNDWEAYFYSYLGEFTSYTNAEAASVATKLGSTIPPAYDMAIADCTPEEASERIKKITTQTTTKILGIALGSASLLRQYEGGNILLPSGRVHYELYGKMRPLVVGTMNGCDDACAQLESKLTALLNSDKEINKETCKECLLNVRRVRYTIVSMEFAPSDETKERLYVADYIKERAEKIHELDPSFEVPQISDSSSSGGCYVATAVYGSYDCPQVWTLRRYRDYTLAETWYGRAFIRTYYAISPTLVRWFGETAWFQNLWRGKLDKWVKELNDHGVEDTPYQDRHW